MREKILVSELLIQADPTVIFTFLSVDPLSFPKAFRGLFPLIPSIEEIMILGDGKLQVGAERSVKLGDGTQIKEQILEHSPPWSHRYKTIQKNLLQSLFLESAEAGFYLTKKENGILTKWEYRFVPKDSILSLIIMPVFLWGLQIAMSRCLEKTKVILNG
jgi:hypothetical protein